MNNRSFKVTVMAWVVGLGILVLGGLPGVAAEQPKPGPEHKKLEAFLGDWTYEGTSEATPLSPADSFKGRASSRSVLGGFFVETQEEDKGQSGMVYKGIILRGYNSETKTYFSHGFENDGQASIQAVSLSGETWTTLGSRKDPSGKVYKTRSTDTFSADGKTMTFQTEYSADDGQTWKLLWKGTMKRAKQSKG